MYKKMKNTHKKQLERVRKFLGDIDWFFSINNFHREIIVKDSDDAEGVAAEFYFDKKYQHIEISLYPLFFRLDQEEQRKCLLHELCHSFTLDSKEVAHNMLRGIATDEKRIASINEEMTSKFENLLHGLLIGKYRYAKRAYRDYLKKTNKK